MSDQFTIYDRTGYFWGILKRKDYWSDKKYSEEDESVIAASKWDEDFVEE